MPVFVYKALDARGKNKSGLVDAENVRAARLKLRGQGIFPTALEEAAGKEERRAGLFGRNSGKRRSVRAGDISIATRQLATLVGAGMPLVESLRALGDQIDDRTLKQILSEVSEQVNEGSTLANALKDHPRVFPRLYVNMVASGEASGSLELVLGRLADLLESQAALRRKVGSALTYPILMLTLCFGVVILLLAYVVPQITAIFQERGAVLPTPTRAVIALSDFVRTFWPLLIAAGVGAVYGFRWYAGTLQGKKRLDGLLLKLPFIGRLALKVATSRLSRNLGTMLQSGIELLSALSIAKNIVGNSVLESAVDSAIAGVREGGSLADQLEKSHLFPRLLIHMVAIGEKTGQLESMLIRAADSYDSEVQAVISSLTSILEPVLILFLAVIVGAILAAVMLPMLEMTSLANT